AADPPAVLDNQRLVETEIALDLELLAGIDNAGRVDKDIGDISGHQPHRHENQDRHPEQRQQHQRKAAQQVACHIPLLRMLRRPATLVALLSVASRSPARLVVYLSSQTSSNRRLL